MNNLNSVLHFAEDSIPVSIRGHGYSYKVEVYDLDAKVRSLSVYTFHPYQTSYWCYFKNWLIEFWYGKTVVTLKIKSHPSKLYLKVDELSRLLKISSKKIQEQTIGEDASQFLINHQKRVTLEKIKNLLKGKNVFLSDFELSTVKEVIKQVGYRNIFKALDHQQFNPGLIASTLIEVGKQIIQNTSYQIQPQSFYEFEIALPNIFIWYTQNNKKMKMNLKNLTFTVEDLPKSLLPLTNNQATIFFNKLSKNFHSSPSFSEMKKSLQNISKSLGVDIKHYKHLEALANRVNYSHLVLVLEGLKPDAKRIMMDTFIKIGKKLSTPTFLDGIFSNFRLCYVGRKKQGTQQLTYAFAINKKDIFINQEKLEQGGFKVVSTAIKLNRLDDYFVRVKIKKEKMKGTNLIQAKVTNAIDQLKKEAKFLERLHQNKKEPDCQYIVLPFICEIITGKKDKKIILFQKKYDGNGVQLRGAPLLHQLYVFRDIALGLNFIHSLGFVYMDMKPANCLLEGNLKSQVPVKGRICDFGMTIEEGAKIRGGSMLYLPFEALLLDKNKRSLHFNLDCQVQKKIDSFCLGVTLLEIIDSTPTQYLGLLNQSELDQVIESYKQRVRLSQPKNEVSFKLSIIDIAGGLLRYHPAQRLYCIEAANRLGDIIKDFNQT